MRIVRLAAGIVLGMAGLLVVGGLALGWLRRGSGLEIPVPAVAGFGALDPQVREYLATRMARVEDSPKDRALRADLGLALAVNGLWSEARTSFLDAIRLGASGPLPRMYSAIALQEEGNPAGALRELEEVVRRYPGETPARYRLALALMAVGESSRAEREFLEVTKQRPEEWRGWSGVGEARLRLGRPEDAIQPLERAIQSDPMARSAYQLLGQAYRAVGRLADADRAMAAGIAGSVGPIPDAWSGRALEHMRLLPDQFERADGMLATGRASEAVALLREAHRHHPEDSSVLARLARALVADGRGAEARAMLERALETSSGDVVLLVAASEVMSAMDSGAEALVLARRALELLPGSADAKVAEANAHLAMENDEAAVEALERALERAPGHVGLRLQLGEIQHRNLGRPDLARATYQEALKRDPIHPVVLERLAELSAIRREVEMAEAYLAELRRLRVDLDALKRVEALVVEARSRP